MSSKDEALIGVAEVDRGGDTRAGARLFLAPPGGGALKIGAGWGTRREFEVPVAGEEGGGDVGDTPGEAREEEVEEAGKAETMGDEVS